MSRFEANCHFMEKDTLTVKPIRDSLGADIHIEAMSDMFDTTVCLALSAKEAEALAMYILQTLGKIPYPAEKKAGAGMGEVKC